MSHTTVALIDPFHPAIVQAIRNAMPAEWALEITTGPSPEEHAKALANATVLFVMATPTPSVLLAGASRLRFIQKLGAGVDRIDLAMCKERGIGVARLQAGNDIPVAEHTLLLMLAACRRLPTLDRRTRAGGWEKENVRGTNRQITGRTVGLIGMGAIGRKVAHMLSGFNARIVYYDPFRAPGAVEKDLNLTYLPLDELLEQADIVSLHVPLMPETAGLINAARIRSMKLGSILINCARGGLVDETALHVALSDGHLFAAGIDAFSAEPPVGSPLLTLDQTVVTPHCAGATLDNFTSVAQRAVANTKQLLTGGDLPPSELVLAPSVRTRNQEI